MQNIELLYIENLVTMEQVQTNTVMFGNGNDKTHKVKIALNEALHELNLVDNGMVLNRVKVLLNALEIALDEQSLNAMYLNGTYKPLYPVWLKNTNYNANDIVFYNGTYYEVINALLSNEYPNNDTTNYNKVALSSLNQYDAWQSAQQYTANTILIYNDNKYLVIKTVISDLTPDVSEDYVNLSECDYQHLYNEIVSYVSWLTYSIYLSFSNITDTDNGLQVFTGDNSDGVDSKLIHEHTVKAENRSNRYKNRLVALLNSDCFKNTIVKKYANRYKRYFSGAGKVQRYTSNPY